MHHHGLAPEALSRMEREPGRFGVEMVTAEGKHVLRFLDGKTVRVPPKWTDLAERKAHLAAMGIDGAVLSTQIDLHRYTLPAEEGIALARALNDGMADWLDGEPMLRGMATLPLQDGGAAAEELRRATEDLGLVGAMIKTHVAGRNLDAPELEPLWQAAEALRAPIFIHPSDVLGASDRLSCYYMANLLGNPFETTMAAASLILAGVLDRHPDLTLVLAHGGGYLSLAFGRLTHGYTHVAEVQFPAKEPPGNYLRRFFYDTILYDLRALEYLVELVGAERILVGSDYPFPMEPEEIVGMVRQLAIPPAEQDRILENAARLYGF